MSVPRYKESALVSGYANQAMDMNSTGTICYEEGENPRSEPEFATQGLGMKRIKQTAEDKNECEEPKIFLDNRIDEVICQGTERGASTKEGCMASTLVQRLNTCKRRNNVANEWGSLHQVAWASPNPVGWKYTVSTRIPRQSWAQLSISILGTSTWRKGKTVLDALCYSDDHFRKAEPTSEKACLKSWIESEIFKRQFYKLKVYKMRTSIPSWGDEEEKEEEEENKKEEEEKEEEEKENEEEKKEEEKENEEEEKNEEEDLLICVTFHWNGLC
ncbi:hypothetical protein P7K49_029899 [Saguinus oedipus]|uniref:Uncharacterized protein n=1 Tax=Saguinus oedipus TaxID=9490 RepID=A0ABQ9U9C7_SAGOE|nr:hypothetical protein P7K49_029899 [Saguinus oedipus]